MYKITTKQRSNCNGIRIEPGMSVQVVSNSFSDPIHTNGGQLVIDAFMRVYGIDIKKAALSGLPFVLILAWRPCHISTTNNMEVEVWH